VLGAVHGPVPPRVFTVGNGTSSCVRFWEQNGSGGPLSGAVRRGHRTQLDVSDVQECRITAASPGYALTSHRGGQGDFGRSVKAPAAARAADLSRHAQRGKNPAGGHEELLGDAEPDHGL